MGTLWSSFNLDLSSNQGKIRVSPRLMTTTTSADDSDLGVPFAFVKDPNQAIWYAAAGSYVFKGGDVPNDVFTQDAATNTPTIGVNRADMVVFNGSVYLINGSIYKLSSDGTSWSSITVSANQCNGQACVFGSRLYFVYGSTSFNNVFSIDTSDTPPPSSTNTVSLTSLEAFSITCMRSTTSHIWIGAQDPNEGIQTSRMYRWDGVTNSISTNDTFVIPASAVLAICIKDNTPWIIDSNGILRKFNGAQFEEVDRLPTKIGKYLANPIGGGVNRAVHFNGMQVDGDDLLILIDGMYNDTNSTQEERIQSGIWKYNSTNGLHHYASVSYWDDQTTVTPTDFGQSRIAQVGALTIAKTTDTTSTTDGSILAGVGYYTTATVSRNAIFVNNLKDTNQKAGYFVTPKIFSPNIQESWQKLYLRIRRLLASTDKIVVKYRVEEDAVKEATITWSNDGDVLSTTQTGLSVGDEIEITQGIGSGLCAHITEIETQGSTYHLTIDETVSGISAGTTAKARFQTWKKLGIIDDQDIDFKSFLIAKESTWVQFKVWILSTGENEIHDIIITNKPFQLAQ